MIGTIIPRERFSTYFLLFDPAVMKWQAGRFSVIVTEKKGTIQRMGWKKRPGSDLGELRKRHDRQNLFAVVAGLIIIGSVLIGLVYGRTAFFVSLPCLTGGALVVLLLFGLLGLLELAVKRDGE